MDRSILHCDLNNFYASVECINHPELRDKFVAVCGSVEERHGIVLAKNQKAKLMGVKTGDAIWQARQKCPELIVVKPHFEEYIKYSKIVRDIYYRFTDLVEPFGMDECWLDVTGSEMLFGNATEIAYKIKETIKKETGLTISVGVSFNKVFAKLGSDLKKPDAVSVITKDDFKNQIWHLPANELLWVGRATYNKLLKYNVKTIGELANTPPDILKCWFGINGEMLWRFANGLDVSRVRHIEENVPIKSIGNGITCIKDLYTFEEVWRVLFTLCDELGTKLRENNLSANGVRLTVKDNRLVSKTFQAALPFSIQSSYFTAQKAMEIFKQNYDFSHPVRSLSVTVYSLGNQTEYFQLSLSGDTQTQDKKCKIETTADRIQKRFGENAILPAVMMLENKMPEGKSPDIVLPGMMHK